MFFNPSGSKKTKLPTTPEQFDELVEILAKKYHLTDKHHAAAILSIAIMHLPPTQAYATYDYLGHYILKNIAYHIANHKSQILKHESQIDHLVTMLKDNPLDNQSFDALQKAASEGSDYAKNKLDEIQGSNTSTAKADAENEEKKAPELNIVN